MLDFGNYNNMNKKAAIYDPYLDTLGGGERYCLTIAEILLQHGYSVDLYWSGDPNLIIKAQQRFNLDLARIRIVKDIFNFTPNNINFLEDIESLTKISTQHHRQVNFFYKTISIINKFWITKDYQLFFYLSDWSIPFLFSKNSLLHVQVPFSTEKKSSLNLINKFKLYFYNHIICNSQFTQNFAQNYFGHKSLILYPPVDVDKFNPSVKKENIILSMGRFDNLLNSKKQDIMIKAFQELYPRHPDWKLVFTGGSVESPDKNKYLVYLKEISSDLPVEFIVNPNFETLAKYYSLSKIYWHAAGYDVDENIHPENTEHFGIAPVEAMASGSVPLVVAKGGLPEIVDNNQNGYLWHNLDELLDKTNLLINSPQLLQKLSSAAIIKSKKFSKQEFTKNFLPLLKL